MIVRCWGSRGSIPVSGAEYLIYGGDTTCFEVRTKNGEVIVIDAGSGIRRLGHQLLKEQKEKYSIFFTHAHLDHVLGLPFFRPIYKSGVVIKIFGCQFEYGSIEEMLSKILSPPTSPISFGLVEADISYQNFCEGKYLIDSVEIYPIFISHPNKGLGFKFIEDDKIFVFMTDNEITYKHPGGLDYQEYVDFAANADLFYHDSEFSREEYVITKTWGHSVFNDSLKLALDADVRRFGLIHHNQERTDQEIDAIVSDCKSICKEQHSDLEVFAVHAGLTITL